jgi:hypothetical protein
LVLANNADLFKTILEMVYSLPKMTTETVKTFGQTFELFMPFEETILEFCHLLGIM